MSHKFICHGFLVAFAFSCVLCQEPKDKEEEPMTTTALPEMYSSLCSNPQQVSLDDTLWLIQESSNSAVDRYPVMLNPVARLHFAEILKAQILTYSDDLSNMCSKSYTKYLDSGEIDVFATGFGNLTDKWKCFSNPEDFGVLECTFYSELSKYRDSSKVFLTYIDRATFIGVTVWCFPNGETGWVALSRDKVMSPEARMKVINHIGSIGFNTTDSDIVTGYDMKVCDKM